MKLQSTNIEFPCSGCRLLHNLNSRLRNTSPLPSSLSILRQSFNTMPTKLVNFDFGASLIGFIPKVPLYVLMQTKQPRKVTFRGNL